MARARAQRYFPHRESGYSAMGLERAVVRNLRESLRTVAANCRGGRPPEAQSVMTSLISSELPLSSGAYIAEARVGRALNRPGISARSR